MLKKQKFKKKLEKLKNLIKKRDDLKAKKSKILSDLFKCETQFLETTQGLPITKTSDYYVATRVEKKKYNLSDKDRIFSRDFPRNKL